MARAATHPDPPSRSGTDVTETAQAVACAQVRGGNGRIETPVELPGLHGSLSSTPSDGGSGGDVYFLSVCGSGLLTRICIADLVGHGERVARLSARMHELLTRLVSWPDHRRILRELNASLVSIGCDALTTAAIFTYYPPTRTLTFTYAGHPPGWYYRARERRWTRLNPDAASTPADVEFVDGMLGVTERVAFTRTRLKAEHGDRILLVTDGVLETPDAEHRQFGTTGLEALLEAAGEAAPADLARLVLDKLSGHRGNTALKHDDVTLLALEVREGPRGPALWHVLRNRILRPLGLVAEARPA